MILSFLQNTKDFGKNVTMLHGTFSQWRGFEIKPQGCLLEQAIDLSSDLGVAYERSCQFFKDIHVHDRWMLVFPRGASVMEVRTQNPKKTYRFTSHELLLVPKGLKHDDEGISSIYDTIALYPSLSLIEEVKDEESYTENQKRDILNQCAILTRSRWLEELVQEFFFEFIVQHKRDSTKFFGKQIVKEVFRSFFQRKKDGKLSLRENEARKSEASENENRPITKALKYIESNLFNPLTIEEVGLQSGASASTLLRAFKKNINTTPYQYIRKRRIEEATGLLQKGNHSIGEVALLVGYENFGAFTDAFKTEKGILPSKFKK